MIIRKAKLEDERGILQLYNAVADHEPGLARKDYEVDDNVVHGLLTKSMETGLVLVAVDNDSNEIIGELHTGKPLIKVDDQVFSDLTIAVDPKYQGQNVGKAIFITFMEMMKNVRPKYFILDFICTKPVNEDLFSVSECDVQWNAN
jgi:ribosomal protein S18 acetylase RimI-like enzyme